MDAVQEAGFRGEVVSKGQICWGSLLEWIDWTHFSSKN